MRQKKIITIILGITLIFGGLGIFLPSDASAEHLPFQYSVKFVCGKTTNDNKVVKGLYGTAINIHNPLHIAGATNPVWFEKQAVIAYTETPDGQPIDQLRSVLRKDILLPDGALEVDCGVIRKQLFAGMKLPPLIKGFVVLRTRFELDVVAVYTARDRRTKDPTGSMDDVDSIDVEYIQPRRMPVIAAP
ncbi:MAG: hypothetical protein ACE5EA_05505 [Nitrospirota bacterium]